MGVLRHSEVLLIGVECAGGAMTVHLPAADPEGDEPMVFVALDIA